MAVAEEQIVIVDEWRGLYGESWKGLICDEAFAHPAKFSRALIRKIYDHVIAEGWAKSGDRVIDPFGGVALGGFDAMRHGLYWHGCELEEKFVGLGNQNIALWNERFSRMPNWGVARLLQGDSRKLIEVFSAAGCCVSSPPYAAQDLGGGEGQRKLSGTRSAEENKATKEGKGLHGNYGRSGGQLGAMKEGDHSIAITSPPYIESLKPETEEQTRRKQERIARSKTLYDGRKMELPSPGKAALGGGYGTTEGNVAAMPEGQLCVSSPPFEKGAEGNLRADKLKDPVAFATAMQAKDGKKGRHGVTLQARIEQLQKQNTRTYGDNPENIGNQSGETFWSASRLILQQLHQVILPGGHAVFVVKAFVRDKKIVDFPGQWAQLCEAVGFRLVHDHHALLVEKGARQPAMDDFDVQGDTWRIVTRDKDHSVARKSFFRRLAEAKGSPRIDHENVLCFKKVA